MNCWTVFFFVLLHNQHERFPDNNLLQSKGTTNGVGRQISEIKLNEKKRFYVRLNIELDWVGDKSRDHKSTKHLSKIKVHEVLLHSRLFLTDEPTYHVRNAQFKKAIKLKSAVKCRRISSSFFCLWLSLGLL